MDKNSDGTKVLEDAAKQGRGQQNPPINWGELFKKFVLYGGLIAIGITIFGGIFTYALHVSEQIGELKDRVGKIEGRLDESDKLKSNTQQMYVFPTSSYVPTPMK